MARFQILAFDGGGVRGAFGLGFLQELESQTNRKVRDCFDLIAGTSTGAITAMGLGIGHGGNELVDFYDRFAKKIFKAEPPFEPDQILLRHIYSLVHTVIESTGESDIDHFFRARYSADNLRECLEEGFYSLQMKDISGPRVIVPSTNLTTGTPHIFGTPHLPMHLPDAELRLVDVLMATTAAPTYFPHHVMPNGDTFVDGGLWANSPGLLGLGEALKLRQLCVGDHCPTPFSTNEIFLLNIGSGTTKFSMSPPGKEAGSLYWAQNIADVMMSAQVQGLQVPLRFLLADRVKSINFELPDKTWKLDAIDHMHEIMDLGRKAARENRSELEDIFLSHTADPYEAIKDQDHGDSQEDGPVVESAL